MRDLSNKHQTHSEHTLDAKLCVKSHESITTVSACSMCSVDCDVALLSLSRCRYYLNFLQKKKNINCKNLLLKNTQRSKLTYPSLSMYTALPTKATPTRNTRCQFSNIGTTRATERERISAPLLPRNVDCETLKSPRQPSLIANRLVPARALDTTRVGQAFKAFARVHVTGCPRRASC